VPCIAVAGGHYSSSAYCCHTSPLERTGQGTLAYRGAQAYKAPLALRGYQPHRGPTLGVCLL
jgi:hypothetical protein